MDFLRFSGDLDRTVQRRHDPTVQKGFVDFGAWINGVKGFLRFWGMNRRCRWISFDSRAISAVQCRDGTIRRCKRASSILGHESTVSRAFFDSREWINGVDAFSSILGRSLPYSTKTARSDDATGLRWFWGMNQRCRGLSSIPKHESTV
jgi:hypothetical protein